MINDVKSNGNSVRVCVNIKTLENISNSVNNKNIINFI